MEPWDKGIESSNLDYPSWSLGALSYTGEFQPNPAVESNNKNSSWSKNQLWAEVPLKVENFERFAALLFLTQSVKVAKVS